MPNAGQHLPEINRRGFYPGAARAGAYPPKTIVLSTVFRGFKVFYLTYEAYQCTIEFDCYCNRNNK